jgi:hypothetical protein
MNFSLSPLGPSVQNHPPVDLANPNTLPQSSNVLIPVPSQNQRDSSISVSTGIFQTIIPNSSYSLDLFPQEIIKVIYSNILSIKALGIMALVCKYFNLIQNEPYLWRETAKKFNYLKEPYSNEDIKLQIRNGKMDLGFGIVCFKEKKVYFNAIKFKDYSLSGIKLAAKQVISLFSKNHFLVIKDLSRILNDANYYYVDLYLFYVNDETIKNCIARHKMTHIKVAHKGDIVTYALDEIRNSRSKITVDFL